MLWRNTLFGLFYFAAVGCFCCVAQTSSPNAPGPAFFQPGLQLRQQRTATPAAQTVAEPYAGPLGTGKVAAGGSAQDQLSSSTPEGLHGSYVRPDQFYLVRSEPPAFQNGADRFFDQVFRPKEFRVGKFAVSSSITTAIKRKNPLCLLNPIVFQASW